MAGQHRFDLAQLDAEAAQLDLVVEAAEAEQLAVVPPADAVAGAVEARARLAGEGIGHEPFGGDPRPPQVAAGDAVAAQVELAHAPRPAAARRRRRPRSRGCWRSASRPAARSYRRGRAGPRSSRWCPRRGRRSCRPPAPARRRRPAAPAPARAARRAGRPRRPNGDAVEPQQLGQRRRHGGEEFDLLAGRQGQDVQHVGGEDHRAAAGEREESSKIETSKQTETVADTPESSSSLNLGGRPGEEGDRVAVGDRHPLGRPVEPEV